MPGKAPDEYAWRSFCKNGQVLRRLQTSKADYAAQRMAAAVKRMGATTLSSQEWELALRWATIWGMATRICSRCRGEEMCAYPAQPVRPDKADKEFSGT